MMTRADLLPYLSYLLDDARGEHPLADLLPNARLIGWQCGFEPLVVAVQSYLPDTTLDADEAEEIASDFLDEWGWFAGEPRPADYVL